MTTSTENIVKIAFTILTGIAAALGVQMSPAARPEDVSAVVRDALDPLKTKVDLIAVEQGKQGDRLTKVESIVIYRDATSTEQ